MTTTVNSAADIGLPGERPEPKAQSIMDLFAEWQALDGCASTPMTDEENEARAAKARNIVQAMKDARPKTAAEMAAIIYSDTLGFQVYSEEESSKYLLDVIEAAGGSPRPNVIPDIDVASLSIRDMRAIFDALGMIDDVCTAISCQPRCVAETSRGLILGMTPAGDFMEAIEGWACALRARIREEAIRRKPSPDRFNREYQMHMALHGSETPEEAIRIATAFIRSDIPDFTAEAAA